MSAKVNLTFNSAGFREILLGDGVHDLIEKTADNIADRANSNLQSSKSEGFQADVWQGAMMSRYGYGGRWIGSVSSMDREAAAEEAEDKVLSRAVNG